jgi:hypothetical protein
MESYLKVRVHHKIIYRNMIAFRQGDARETDRIKRAGPAPEEGKQVRSETGLEFEQTVVADYDAASTLIVVTHRVIRPERFGLAAVRAQKVFFREYLGIQEPLPVLMNVSDVIFEEIHPPKPP